jgi:hypothetical protein
MSLEKSPFSGAFVFLGNGFDIGFYAGGDSLTTVVTRTQPPEVVPDSVDGNPVPLRNRAGSLPLRLAEGEISPQAAIALGIDFP